MSITALAITLSTVASGPAQIGGSISDTASLTEAVNPTGTITFSLYGPNDATCSGTAIFTSSIPVSNGSATSLSFTPRTAGTYRWIGSYSGDEANSSVSSSCNDPDGSTVVSPGQATVTTIASPNILWGGGSVSDTALVGGYSTGNLGTITFRLYGPDDDTCSRTPVFQTTGVTTVGGSFPVPTDAFYPPATGTYRWVATYNGDPNHYPVSGVCGEASETVVVSKWTLSLGTTASPAITLGGAVTDTATLSGGGSPTGTMMFQLYGPNDTNCGAPPVFTAVKQLAGYVSISPPFTPTVVGTYRWIANYSGDIRYNALYGACGEPSETVVVGFPPVVSITKELNEVTIVFKGAPEGTYQIQYCPSLFPGGVWINELGARIADSQGLFTFRDTTNASTRLYRAIQ